MRMLLSEAARAVCGTLAGSDSEFTGVSTDSRTILKGDLFVALRGKRFDGHEFAASCLSTGAVAAMIDEHWVTGGRPGPWLIVADTRRALGALAAHWRSKFAIPVIAVTGSNGKTTVKEMLAAILRVAASSDDAVLATQGNLNNDIGLPKTLFRLDGAHDYAVLEMGMNHAGEIAYLTRLALPDVALINNAMPAHLDGLGSVEGVARAKGEIFLGLAKGGTAVINADDAYAGLWRELAAPYRILTFGLEQPSDVSASYRLEVDGSEIFLHTPQGDGKLRLALPGLHNVRNALAAAAAAQAVDVPLAAIIAGLQRYRGATGRLQQRRGYAGCTLIDDTYNANPASVCAAIDVLAACAGRRFLVLGDMGELGVQAAKLHRHVGAYALAAGLDGLLTFGELAHEYGGCHYDTPEALVNALRPKLAADATVLVKGSRFMHMERVVALLNEKCEIGGDDVA